MGWTIYPSGVRESYDNGWFPDNKLGSLYTKKECRDHGASALGLSMLHLRAYKGRPEAQLSTECKLPCE